MKQRIALLSVVLMAILAWVFLQKGTAGVEPGPAPPGASSADAPAGPPIDLGSVPAAQPRPAPELQRQTDLADAPTAFLVIVDRKSGAPVPGAAVYRRDGGMPINFSDAEGRSGLPLKQPTQLAIVADGYLLRLCPVHPGSTAAEPQRVQLEPDRYSRRCRFRFEGPGGVLVDQVKVRFEPPQSDTSMTPPPAVQQGGSVVLRAWQEHTMLASLPSFTALQVQLGAFNSARVYDLHGEDSVLFLGNGLFQLDAATEGGLVGRAAFQVDGAVGEPLVVRLAEGKEVTGTVLDQATDQPIAEAEIDVRGGDPRGLLARTDAQGRFRIGPFPQSALQLHVRHREHESTTTGSVTPGGAAVTILMQPMVGAALRGRVRARPGLQVLVGATVTATDSSGQPNTTETDANGTFSLHVAGGATVRVLVAAAGYLPYSELLEPKGELLDYDLWPAQTAVRVQQQLTAVLSGLVVDDAGLPVPGMPVRLLPERLQTPPGILGRRVLDGGALALPLTVASGPDGTFQLETMQAGPGKVFPIDGVATADLALPVDVVLGQSRTDLRLVARRPK